MTACTVVKSKGKTSQNFVAFSEYMNFKSEIKPPLKIFNQTQRNCIAVGKRGITNSRNFLEFSLKQNEQKSFSITSQHFFSRSCRILILLYLFIVVNRFYLSMYFKTHSFCRQKWQSNYWFVTKKENSVNHVSSLVNHLEDGLI